MTTEQLVPQIRFKGFSKDLSNQELKDIVQVNSGKDYKHLGDGNIPVYGTGGYMLCVNDKLSDIDAVGIGRKGTINKPQYLQAPFWTVDTLFFLTSRNNDISYIFYLLSTINWLKYDESTGVPSLSKRTIETIKTPIHNNKEEQTQIGTFFQKLDRSIELQESLLEQYEDYKKSMLQKMFPKDGQTVPEIRFGGFSGEWKKTILNNVADTTTGSSNREDSLESGLYTFFDRSSDVRRSDKYLFDEEAIIVPGEGQSFVPKYYFGKFDLHQRAYAVMNFKNNYFPLFFYYLIGLKNNYFLSQAVGTTVKSLRLPMFQKMPVLVPCLEEQTLIGNFFQRLDKKIELQAKKVEQYKEFKKAMLQKMFV